jgi:hypothetical protein
MKGKIAIKILIFCFLFSIAALAAADFALADQSAYSVNLYPSQSSGCAPLANVDLTAYVYGTVNETLTYYFDCTSDGSWEKTIKSSANPVTAYGICNFGSVGDYTAKVRIEQSNGDFAENSAKINVYACYPAPSQSSYYYPYYSSYFSSYSSYSPSVDLQANGFESSVTIPYNTSAVLTWNSSNADYCNASGDWSGSKYLTGSETTGNLTYSKTYTLNCSGFGGSAIDSVTVNVSPKFPSLTLTKLVSDVSKGTAFQDSVAASPGDLISFSIQIRTGNSYVYGAVLKDTTSGKILYSNGSLMVDGVSWQGDLFSGLDMGNLLPNQMKTITYSAVVSGAQNFVYGENKITNSATVYNNVFSVSDAASVIVNRVVVAGVSTVKPGTTAIKPVVAGTSTTGTAGTSTGAASVSTGLTNNIFFDTFLIPLLIAMILVWLFRSNIIKLEQWLDRRKGEYRQYKSNKLFQLKIKKIKAQEYIRKK